MTRTTPELAPPSPNFHATPTGGRLTTTYDLTCNRPHTRRIFQWNRVSNLEPSGPKAETLPLGHRGLNLVPDAILKNDIQTESTAVLW
ncbi:hypothetical protein AVEN_201964-1 [Araneus ventricosus]|uniref:Uncharacterized protein n=1 Tax=Araneus ventricosus TaxID=182803 RepID=A0A4Y2QAH0_ARAVE|nr:hypothetical protein AVEN_201964-1 [Araneus ventricosus]